MTKDKTDVTEPQSNAEKFKPQNVQEDGKAGPGLGDSTDRDLPRGSESHVRRKSMNRS